MTYARTASGILCSNIRFSQTITGVAFTGRTYELSQVMLTNLPGSWGVLCHSNSTTSRRKRMHGLFHGLVILVLKY